MNRFLFPLFALCITSPAFAEGRYQDGGCTTKQLDSFCILLGFLLVCSLIFTFVSGIHHDHKMKTDPIYRKDWEAKQRVWDEENRQRRGY